MGVGTRCEGRGKIKHGKKETCLDLFIKGMNIKFLRAAVWNLPNPKESYQWSGWVTHAHIDENPVIRGHDLCFDKTCQ